MCIKNQNVSDDWEHFIDIYKAVEMFKRKQNKGKIKLNCFFSLDTIYDYFKIK